MNKIILTKNTYYYITDYTIYYLSSDIFKNKIILPNKDNIKLDDKLFILESIISYVPLYTLIFVINNNKQLELVKGYSIVKTIREYLNGKLVFTNLKNIPSLNNTKFYDLNPTLKDKIGNIQLRSYIYNSLPNIELINRLNKFP